mmetsp:Transcript_4953/g.8867  ORF Transcript_4953/g.8867 Transcript_4953/m.8867 type:complete len:119 (+) Transcript_4953:609-965(+)
MIVFGLRPFAFEDVNGHFCLIVLDGMKLHGRLRWYGRATFDQHGHQPPVGIGAQTERGDIQQHEILDGLSSLAAQDAPLNGRTHGHRFIGVDTLVWFLAIEKILDEFLHFGYASGSSD